MYFVMYRIQEMYNFFWDELEQIKVWTPQIGTTEVPWIPWNFDKEPLKGLLDKKLLGKLGGYNGSLTDYSTTKKAWLCFRYCKIHK